MVLPTSIIEYPTEVTTSRLSATNERSLIGTFHTHPYRAAPTGEALKEPGLSQQDLKTFTGGTDRVLIVVWDVDSLDVALRAADGRVVHPALLLPR